MTHYEETPVTDTTTDHPDHPGALAAAPRSILAGIRAQRDAIKAELFTDFSIPKYENLHVRYKAPTKADLAEVRSRAEKAKDLGELHEALILAKCCVGIFSRDENGKPLGDPADWPKFDHELAEALGLPENTRAVEVVRALFATEGDVMAQSAALIRWAGFAEEQALEEHEGN